MELGDPFADELGEWRAKVDEHKKHLDEARRQLQVAGRSAFAELRQAGHTSQMVAQVIGVSGSTVRKLNSDGDRSGWLPLSPQSYASLDAYTGSRLAKSWDLAQRRDAVDNARDGLRAAERRLAEVSSRTGRAVPPFDLGILFIPGLPERRVDRSLRQFGDALADCFAKDRDGSGRGTSVQVTEAQLTTDGKEPARLVLRPDRPDGGDDGGGEEDHRWLVGVSPVDHGLLDDQDLRGFLRWLLVALPWFAADVFDRRHAQARCLPGARLTRWSRAARNAITGLVGIPVLLLTLVIALACLVALFLPVVRVAGRTGAGLLSRGFGLTFACARSQATLGAQVNRAVQDLARLRRHCQKVAVVAHGHGVPIAHGLVRRAPPDAMRLLVTLGSPLRRFRFAQALEGRPEHTFAGIGGLLAWLLAAASLIMWPGIAALVALLALRGDDPPATALAAVSTAVLGALTVWLAGWSRRVLRTEVLPVRLRALSGLQQQSVSPPWLDLASAADPVADGLYLAAAAPLGEVQVEVTHQASAWADHRAYLEPGSEALRRLLAELARVAPAPGKIGTIQLGAARRVRWLVIARRAAAVSGLVGAIVLLPRLPAWAMRSGLGVAALVLLWAAGAAVAYAVLKSCWRLWDYSQRGYEVAAAAGREVTDVPVSTGFALLLGVLALAVIWPVGLALGWWTTLLHGAVAVAARFDGGDPGQRPTVLLIELALAILVVFGATVALGLLLSRPVVRRRLERRRHLPDPVAAASLLLQRLPDGGLRVGESRYRAAPVEWDVSVPGLWRRGEPTPCTTPARMLLRDDAVVLDLRDGCMLRGRVAHVHGRAVHCADERGSATARPRRRTPDRRARARPSCRELDIQLADGRGPQTGRLRDHPRGEPCLVQDLQRLLAGAPQLARGTVASLAPLVHDVPPPPQLIPEPVVKVHAGILLPGPSEKPFRLRDQARNTTEQAVS